MDSNLLEQTQALVAVDAENQSDLDVDDLLQRLSGYEIVEKHAFADWRNPSTEPVSRQLEPADFEMHHVRSGCRPGTRKNTADGHMARIVSKVLRYRPSIPVVVLVTGDIYFVRLARRLRRQGKVVIAVADPLRMSTDLAEAVDQYIPIGKIARSLKALHWLQCSSEYITFNYAVTKLGLRRAELSSLIKKDYVLQDYTEQPGRGIKREIWLNPQSWVVRSVLAAA